MPESTEQTTAQDLDTWQPPADHAEFFPLTSFAAILHGPARAEPPPQIQLETTGITSQKIQAELFQTRLLHKSSVEAKLRTVGCLDIADTLRECHSRQSWAECQGCRKAKTFWNRCENFYCPACQPHLANDRAESIQWWTRQITQPKHVVLTVRNTRELTFAYVRWFKKCLTRLRRSVFADNWLGGTWALEVTNESAGWHLHAHLLIDAKYINQGELAVRWAKLVGQDFAIVKVKDARGQDYLKEVCKYAVKGSQLAKWTGADIATFIHALQGQRTFGVFGSLYGKRTQWKEYIDSISEERGTCECGVKHWRVYDAEAWEAHLIDRQSSQDKPMPPPRRDLRTLPRELFTVNHLADGVVSIQASKPWKFGW